MGDSPNSIDTIAENILWLMVSLAFIVFIQFFKESINQQNIIFSNEIKAKSYTSTELYAEEEEIIVHDGVVAYDGEFTYEQVLAWILNSDEKAYELYINDNLISSDMILAFKYSKNTLLLNYLENDKIYNRFFLLDSNSETIKSVNFITK